MSSATAVNPARIRTAVLAVTGLCVLVSGSTALLGWLLDADWLRGPLPGYTPMKLLTAATLALMGAALLFLRLGQPGTKCRQLARSCAAAGALCSAFSLLMFLLDWGALPGMGKVGASLRSIRSAPSTALCCILLGGAVLMIDSKMRRGRAIMTGLTLAASGLSFLALVGHAYQTPQLVKLGTSIPMALQTALTLPLACAGVFCARPDSSLLAVMANESAGGLLARRLLLPALVVPLVLCWLAFIAQKEGMLDIHLGLALQSLATSVALVGLIWITCLSFHRVDTERLQEQRNLQKAHVELEAAVRERTASLESANKALAWESAVNASLAELSQALITSASMDDVAALVLQHAKQLTESRFGLVGHVDQETGRLVCPTLPRETWEICEAPEGDAVLRKLRWLWERMLAEGKHVLVNLPSTPPGSPGVSPGHVALYRCLSAPALLNGRVVGQVAVAAQRNYTERDVLALERLASLLAIAIQQQRASWKLRETQAQLVQSAKMAAVGQLAAGIAHEINNPMAVISTSAETLQAFLEGRPGAKEALGPLWVSIAEQIENIDSSVFRCKAIIDSLLDFSRAESLEETDLSALLEHTLRLIRASKQGRERALALKVSGQTVFLWNGTGVCDAEPAAAACLPLKTSTHQLQQVVLNLVANAVDATVPGGLITVDATRRGNGVEIAVIDNGKGIAPEERGHLFEPFFTTKPVGKGTGLGLYLSQRIVSALGGKIECETAVGRGTAMRVWLPAAPPEPPEGVAVRQEIG